MNTLHSTAGVGEHPIVITRITERLWHALADDQVVGRADATHRPDGRTFVSIDSWHSAVFDRLAEAILADLPTPLYTVVDEGDLDLTADWKRAGFAVRRREWECVVPTDPRLTGLGTVRPPSGVTIVPAGEAEEGPLRALDRAIREEVEAAIGWREMPAEVLPLPPGVTVLDPSKYAVAAEADRYVGLLRLATVTRQPRIGLIAVRADRQRLGIGTALLAHVLESLHRSGTETAWAEVNEANPAAGALFAGVGAQPVTSNLELVRR